MGVCFRVAAVAAVAEALKTRPFVWLVLWRAPQQLIVKLAGAAFRHHHVVQERGLVPAPVRKIFI